MYVTGFFGEVLGPVGFSLLMMPLASIKADGSQDFLPRWRGFSGELVVTEKIARRHRFIACGARSSRAKASAPGIAVVAPLLSDITGLAARALVDGAGAGHHRLYRRAAACPPSSLAAASGAEPLSPFCLEGTATDRAGARRVIVANAAHGPPRTEEAGVGAGADDHRGPSPRRPRSPSSS